MDMDFTPKENFFRKSMGVLCLIFLLGAILFATIPDPLLRVFNWSGALLKMKAPLVPTQITINKDMWDSLIDPSNTEAYSDQIREWPGPAIWIIMAVTMMLMIAFITGMNFINPRKYISWIPILLLSTASTSILGLLYFYFQARYLSTLIIPIVDFPIFLFVLIIWLRARSDQGELPE
mgnify:CR=1 FL=1